MAYAEDDYLMLSGIQHFQFCKRQWALIHIYQEWAENEQPLTVSFFIKKLTIPISKKNGRIS